MRRDDGYLARAPPRRPEAPRRRRSDLLRRRVRRPCAGALRPEGHLLPAGPVGAGAAERRRRADPAEPDHASAAVPRATPPAHTVPAVRPATACPTATAVVDNTTAAATVSSPAAAAAPTPASSSPVSWLTAVIRFQQSTAAGDSLSKSYVQFQNSCRRSVSTYIDLGLVSMFGGFAVRYVTLK